MIIVGKKTEKKTEQVYSQTGWPGRAYATCKQVYSAQYSLGSIDKQDGLSLHTVKTGLECSKQAGCTDKQSGSGSTHCVNRLIILNTERNLLTNRLD